MGNVIKLFKNTEKSAVNPYSSTSLSRAIRRMEGALEEQAEVFAEYKETNEKLEEIIKSIGTNYALFDAELEKAKNNTFRLQGKSLRLWSIMDDFENPERQLRQG